jgi:hypothetical protein
MNTLNNDQLYVNYLNSLSQQISYYFTITFPFVGIVLNSFSIYIFTRPALNKTNMGLLYLMQNVFLVVYLLLLVFVLRSFVLGYNAVTVNFTCSVATFLRRYLVVSADWISTFITFDRFKSVCYPNRLMFLSKKRNILKCVFLMLFILILLNIQNFLFFIETKTSFNNVTFQSIISANCITFPFNAVFSDIFVSVQRTILPIIIMIIFDIFILLKLWRKKQTLNRGQGAKKSELQYTLTVICINMTYIFFNMPTTVAFILNSIVTNLRQNGLIEISIVGVASLNFFQTFSANLAIAFYTLSFFFHIIFNHLFRKETLALIYLKSSTRIEASENSKSKRDTKTTCTVRSNAKNTTL